ncbi:MAG: cobalt ECF transporter T component CbiQ [Deltaproteobacteria bacterium]|nr:cobalt ECF transporter T component CbiQ [Deltaproteobacteria bacterium]
MEKGIKIPDWFGKTALTPCPCYTVGKGRGFLEKNLEAITSFIKDVLESQGFANRNGLLQAIDPRARLLGILLLILTAAILKGVSPLLGLLVVIVIIATVSKVPLTILLKRVSPIFIFTIFLVFPAAFNLITPGTPLLTIFTLDDFQLYISREGLVGITILLLRVASMVSLISILILTTGYADIFRAFQGLPIPKVFTTALAFVFRYILVLIKVVEDTHLAKKARTIKQSTLKEGQSWLASRIWLIIERSMEMAEGVYMAMMARGFAGEVKTTTLFNMEGRDYLWVGFTMFVFLLSVQL